MNARRVALTLFCIGALGCGRTGDDPTEMIQVQLGMASVSGADLNGATVTKSLIHFDFNLIRFDESLTCGREDSCFWTAQGLMPAMLAEGLTGYRDQALEVLFADPQLSDVGGASVPSR